MKKIINIFVSMFLISAILFNLQFTVSAKDNDQVANSDLLISCILAYSNEPWNTLNGLSSRSKSIDKLFAGYTNNINFKGWTLEDYIINTSLDSDYSFSAITLKKDNNIIIAFRGTDSGMFMENKRYILPFTTHPQAKFACNYLNKIMNSNIVDENTKVYLTGHSLGGYLAVYAFGNALNYSPWQNQIVNVTVYNALGIGLTDNRNIRKVLKSKDVDRLTYYRVKGDIVSQIGTHFKNQITVDYEKLNIDNCLNKHQAESPHSLQHFLPGLYEDEIQERAL